jgi:hypothetical protein
MIHSVSFGVGSRMASPLYVSDIEDATGYVFTSR